MTDTVIYDSARRPHPAIEELAEIWRYRDLVVQFVRRDLVARYKRSSLGVAWTMLNPLGTTLVMSVVFSHVFGRTQSYPVYVLSGLLAWRMFSQSTVSAMRQLVWGGMLIHRIYVPKTVFSVSAVGTGFINLLLSLIPCVGVMLVARVPIRPTVIFLPVAFLLLAAFSLGISLLLSTLAAYFADVAEMYEIVLTAWMYLTPIIYPEDMSAGTLHRWLLRLNPMSYLVHLFRQPLYYGVWPGWTDLAPAALAALLALAAGWLVFSAKADEFVYRI